MPYAAGRRDDAYARAQQQGPEPPAWPGAQLDALRRAVEGRDAPGLAGLLAAAEAAHHEWLRQLDALEHCSRRLHDAQAAAERARLRAEAVLERATESIVGAAMLPSAGPEPARALDQRSAIDDDRALAAHLFGRFRFLVQGVPVATWHGTRPLTVLRYLMARPGRPVPRDVLVDHLWPDVGEEVGRRNLHQVIYSLRRTLREAGVAPTVIVHEHDSYRVDDGVDLWIDVTAYDRALAEARHCDDADDALRCLLRAESLYTDDYLTDALYEEWTMAERERLRLSFLDLGEQLAGALAVRSQWRDVVDVCERRLRLDAAAEGAHRWVMRAYAALGQRDLALQQYRYCCDVLQREYGLTPDPETEALHRSLVS